MAGRLPGHPTQSRTETRSPAPSTPWWSACPGAGPPKSRSRLCDARSVSESRQVRRARGQINTDRMGRRRLENREETPKPGPTRPPHPEPTKPAHPAAVTAGPTTPASPQITPKSTSHLGRLRPARPARRRPGSLTSGSSWTVTRLSSCFSLGWPTASSSRTVLGGFPRRCQGPREASPAKKVRSVAGQAGAGW